MQGLNVQIAAGNLAADPIITTIGDSLKASVMVICNESQRKIDKETGEVTWEDVARPVYGETWGANAKLLQDRGKKGGPIILVGKSVTDEWEDKTTSEKRRRTYLDVSRIILAGSAPESKIADLRKTLDYLARARQKGATTIAELEGYVLAAIDREQAAKAPAPVAAEAGTQANAADDLPF